MGEEARLCETRSGRMGNECIGGSVLNKCGWGIRKGWRGELHVHEWEEGGGGGRGQECDRVGESVCERHYFLPLETKGNFTPGNQRYNVHVFVYLCDTKVYLL